MVTYRMPPPAETQTCTDVLACATTEIIALVLAFSTALFLFAILVLAAAHVRSARSETAEERERVRLEAAAFAAFADRLTGLEARPSGTSSQHVGATTVVETVTATPLLDVQTAYRETVMDVPHYDVEYGEPLAQNMAAEFGDDVASAIATGQALTPQLKGTILQRSKCSHRLRLALLEHLDAEAADISKAAADYDRIADSVSRLEDEPIEEASFEDLVAEWYLLEDRERECIDRLESRQETIQSRQGLAKHFTDAPTLEEYLYRPLDVTYPVLADGTRLLERVREAQSRVVLAIASLGRT